jgi:rhodanese-related sulfurtransferase
MNANRLLAAVALILAVGALIVRNPERDAYVDLSSLAAMIENEKDHIEPSELAMLIRDGTTTVQLIDLRDSIMFARYHIPGARLMTLTVLVNGGVHRNESIVIYSQGGTHASQAWVLLKSKNYPNVRTLLGGMNAWNEEILFPNLSPGADDIEKKNFEEKKTMSLFFGGQPHIDPSGLGRARPQKPVPGVKKQPAKFKKEEDKFRESC